ncbi:MAG: ATP synthase F0 subunit B [Desulfobacterales bacterium]|nr:ATP synthase F0 subunit B [Desulfobacterales bacterium]
MNSELMKKNIKAFLRLLPVIAAVLLVMHSPAFASETSADWRPTYDIIMRWVNFFILMFLIYRYGRQPFKNFLANRKNQVSGELDRLEKRKKEVEDEIEETRRQIQESTERFEKIKSRIIEEGRRKKQQIIDQANEQSRKLLETEKKRAASRIAQARRQLLDETADKAGTIALDMLPREITDEDQRNMLNLYIDNVNKIAG